MAVQGPLVILGAGYAGVRLAREVVWQSRGRRPVILVDRAPVHVLRTELYELDEIARSHGNLDRWAIPIHEVLRRPSVRFRLGEVESIDLEHQSVRVDGISLGYGVLAICLGSVAADYGVPGVREHSHDVYGLSGALRCSLAIRRLLQAAAAPATRPPPRIAVVGGGSTGTEVAAEVATAPWSTVVGRPVPAPRVMLVTGEQPLLSGLPAGLVRLARRTLGEARVELHEHANVVRVAADHLELADGARLPFDLAIWAAGLTAPEVVRRLPVAHGSAGRLRVEPTLGVPGHPEVFGVGDAIDFRDPRSGAAVPASAQAAIREAEVAGDNVVRLYRGKPLRAFHYRERGVLVSLGVGRAGGAVQMLTIWGRPVAVLKSLRQRQYAWNAGRRPRRARRLKRRPAHHAP